MNLSLQQENNNWRIKTPVKMSDGIEQLSLCNSLLLVQISSMKIVTSKSVGGVNNNIALNFFLIGSI